MDERGEAVVFPLRIAHSVEETMLREDVVGELLGWLARGEEVRTIARALGVDRKTVKRWRAIDDWRRQVRRASVRWIRSSPSSNAAAPR